LYIPLPQADPDHALIENEARRIAAQSAEALKVYVVRPPDTGWMLPLSAAGVQRLTGACLLQRARAEARANPVNVPTWTGRFGGAGAGKGGLQPRC
jgi:hypothetical protein